MLARTISTILSACLIILNAPSPARAWRPVTHLHLAEEAINDALDDGKATIYQADYEKGEIVGEIGAYAVDGQILEILKAQRSVYRSGVFGLNTYRDLHADWHNATGFDPASGSALPEDVSLEYLWGRTFGQRGAPLDKTPEAKALVLGFITHAIGELFADSFLNELSGDRFRRGEGALRHIVLEGYIGKRTPGLTQYETELGSAAEEYLYRNLVHITPTSRFGHLLLKKEPAATYPIPWIFSALEENLGENLNRDAGAREDRARQDKTAALQTIESGLREWVRVAHEIAQAIFLEGGESPQGFERAEEMANEYMENHLLPMIATVNLAKATKKLELNDLKKSGLLNYIFRNATGYSWKELKHFLTYPERSFDLIMANASTGPEGRADALSLSEFDSNHLHLKEGKKSSDLSERFDWRTFRPAFNTVQLTKLFFLSSDEMPRLLSDLKIIAPAATAPRVLSRAAPRFFNPAKSRAVLAPAVLLGARAVPAAGLRRLRADGAATISEWKANPRQLLRILNSDYGRYLFMQQAGKEFKPSPSLPIIADFEPARTTEPANDVVETQEIFSGEDKPPALQSGVPLDVPPAPLVIDTDEAFELCAGKTRTATFKKSAQNILAVSEKPEIAQAEILENNNRIQMKGLRTGETVINVRAEIASAGDRLLFEKRFLVKVISCEEGPVTATEVEREYIASIGIEGESQAAGENRLELESRETAPQRPDVLVTSQ